MNLQAMDRMQQGLARLAGVALIITAVCFQRRGLMDWTEVLFLGLCVGMQEAFARISKLRKVRTLMFVAYSALPLLLVLVHSRQIEALREDFVGMVLFTPLPLVLVCMQIMVLYLKESPRLVSVVLVLTLFSVVIGVRRPDASSVWPWMLVITALAALYLALQYPAMIFQGASARRRGPLPPPTPRPGYVMRPAFFGTVAQYAVLSVVAALGLYFVLPRIDLSGNAQPEVIVVGQPGTKPGNGIEPPGPNPRTPRNPDGSPKQPSVSGLGDGVDLGDFGEIKKTSNPAARVKPLDQASGRLKRIYLRAFTYSEFRAGRWTEGQSAAIDLYSVRDGEKRELPRAPGRTGLGWASLSYEIELTRAGVGNKGQVPLPVETRELLDYQGPLQYDARTNMLRAPEMVSGDFFTVNTRTRTLTESQLATALRGRAVSRVDESLRAYVTMPDAVRRGFQARFDRWQELQRIARGDNRTDPIEQRGMYACAREIVRMFREDKFGERPKWEYSLTLRPMPGEYAIVSFMDTRTTESERFGHCEYFASAMCLLLRSYGIPARLCAGFSSDAKDERGHFVVTTGDAHAWVEAWFEGEGWVAFDPTPPGTGEQPDPVASTTDEPQPPAPEPVIEKPDAKQAPGRDWIDGFGDDSQSALYSTLSNTARDWFSRGDTFLRGLTGWMPGFLPESGWLRAALLLVPPLGVLLGFALLRVRRGRRERAMIGEAGKGMTRRHRGLYVQLMMLLGKHGYTRMATETPMEFAYRVQRQGGPLFESVVPLTRLYYDLRYGAKTDAEEMFRQQFTEYARLLRRVVSPAHAAETAA